MNRPFYNTCEADNQMLLDFEASALSQEDLVVEVFRKAKRPLAWFEIQAMLNFDMDQCSLKRATTNLTTDRKDKLGIVIKRAVLEKTKELVMGPKGKPCHRYKLLNY